MRRVEKIKIGLASFVAAGALVLGGCETGDRSGDIQWARDVCADHHGVQDFEPWTSANNTSYVVCRDGYGEEM